MHLVGPISFGVVKFLLEIVHNDFISGFGLAVGLWVCDYNGSSHPRLAR